ncbi:MAG: hypothetical protein ACHQ52_05155 [Candidatus Eisenbacteria bacterium]
MFMKSFSRSYLSDAALLQDFGSRLSLDQSNTAELLATMAEIDVRKLYLPAGYPSMYAYSVGHWHMSEDVAYKRIRAARAARRCPALFVALEKGRLHLAAVVMLAPHLRRENAAELIAAATHRTKAQIELLLAQRFPQPDLVTNIAPVPAPSSAPECSGLACDTRAQLAPGPVHEPHEPAQPAPERVTEPPPARVTPLAPQRFAMQLTIDAETRELLRDVQALLGHTVPSGDLAVVLRESLRLAKLALEKRRFAKASVPRPSRRTKSARHISAHVRREVWHRDQGRCTFVSDSGHRCESRTRLEFDHVTPAARGGEATADNIRLRCRAHNQYEAERVFGERFMRGKRERAGLGSIERRAG